MSSETPRPLATKYPPPKDNLADPQRFVGQPITLRRAWPESVNDFVAIVSNFSLARLTLERRAGDLMVWSWSVTGPDLPRHLKPGGGDCETLAQAKAAVRSIFDSWLEWANAQRGLVTWWGSDSS